MKMVRSRSPAVGTVIQNDPLGTKITAELNKGIRVIMNGLGSVFYVGDGEVAGENGHGIGENQILTPVEDALLFFREKTRAEKAGAILQVLFADCREGAFPPSWVVLEADREPIARYVSDTDVL